MSRTELKRGDKIKFSKNYLSKFSDAVQNCIMKYRGTIIQRTNDEFLVHFYHDIKYRNRYYDDNCMYQSGTVGYFTLDELEFILLEVDQDMIKYIRTFML